MACAKNLKDEIIGKLTVLERLPNKNGRVVWKCLCECGNITDVISTNLTSHHTTSCGCFKYEARKTHGKSNSKTYHAWESMIGRCYNENYNDYKNWGGRGIIVCDRWKTSFENFYEDLDNSPKNLTLDRINTDLNYSCGKCEQCKKHGWVMNCRWTSCAIQSHNKRKRINCSSQYRGVSWFRRDNNWKASIQYNHKNIHIGYFDNESDAAMAYDKKAIEFYGDNANLNFPEGTKNI